ncbi:Hypp7707 [Branchiostoma lanceolatum]|uniref:Hypp7707 protein n=1 Tax=Branchiostoma lanceolatum TaxID=7740 RepID=A0A8J9Z377_BRALA|nr:Hypp7707 [Branchiostoma lanceolatum]
MTSTQRLSRLEQTERLFKENSLKAMRTLRPVGVAKQGKTAFASDCESEVFVRGHVSVSPTHGEMAKYNQKLRKPTSAGVLLHMYT